jgi:hypothetical protein
VAGQPNIAYTARTRPGGQELVRKTNHAPSEMVGISPILVLTWAMEGGQIMDGKRYMGVVETEGEGTMTDVVLVETITVMARFLQQGLGQQMSTPQLVNKL